MHFLQKSSRSQWVKFWYLLFTKTLFAHIQHYIRLISHLKYCAILQNNTVLHTVKCCFGMKRFWAQGCIHLTPCMQLHILIFVALFTPWEVEIHVSISTNFSTRNLILIFYCLSNFRLTERLKFLQSLSPWLWHCSATICWNPWPSGCRFVIWTVPNACVLQVLTCTEIEI